MKRLFILLFLFTINLYAQGEISIVAVGEAELEKDTIAFTSPIYEGSFEGPEKEPLETVIAQIRNDFAFYKHKYNVLISAKLSLEEHRKKSHQIVIGTSFTKREGQTFLKVQGLTTINDKKFIDEEFNVNMANLVGFAHHAADQIYFALTGKRSIFKGKIVFVSDVTSTKKEIKKELYIMDFDGKRIQRLTHRDGIVMSPAFAHDNTKILYTSIEDRFTRSSQNKVQKVKNVNLYMYDLINKNSTPISSRVGINSGAIFSNVNDSIYLTLTHTGNADIFEMNLTTKSIRPVTTHFADDVDPAINGDGTLMTFLSGRSGAAMIYTADPREPEKSVKRISYVGRFNAAPRFSPDGKEIVFSSWVDNRFDIYRIGAQGNNLVRLTKDFGSNEEPNYSPDGEFIIFTSQRVLSRDKAIQDIYIMTREGEIIGRLTSGFGNCFSPKFSK
jgi:TolB protein